MLSNPTNSDILRERYRDAEFAIIDSKLLSDMTIGVDAEIIFNNNHQTKIRFILKKVDQIGLRIISEVEIKLDNLV